MTNARDDNETAAANTLVAVHRLLHPQLYAAGAEEAEWTAELIEKIAGLVEDTLEDLGHVPHGTTRLAVVPRSGRRTTARRYSHRRPR